MDWLVTAPAAIRWVATLAFVAIVVLLSVTPGIERPGDSIFSWLVIHTATPLQKALHVGIYALLALLWMWTLDPLESRWLRAAIALAITVAIGVILEWYQTYVPGRYGTITDVMLNVIGAILGLLAAFRLRW